MKKKLMAIVAAGAALALSAALFAGCGQEQKKEEPAAPAAEAVELVVGFDAEYPPYGFMGDDGQYTGFDLDLAQMVSDKLGWTMKAEPIDWDAKDGLLDGGQISCIWNGFTYEGREDKYAWSGRYMLNEQVVVVKADADMKELADLKGKVVMTQKGSAALGVLEDEEGQKALADTFKDLQTIADYNNAFMQLQSGAVEAVACDLSIANFQIAAKADAYKILGTLSSESYAVGFKLGEDGQALADQVTTALGELDADGKIKELCEKYADLGITYDNWILGK